MNPPDRNPAAPKQGQLYVDREGNFWRVRKVSVAASPRGFFMVHMQHGATEGTLRDAMVLGPREFAALQRERQLQPHFIVV